MEAYKNLSSNVIKVVIVGIKVPVGSPNKAANVGESCVRVIAGSAGESRPWILMIFVLKQSAISWASEAGGGRWERH